MTIGSPVGTVTTYTFPYTGSVTTWTVPRHDGPILLVLRGGQGGAITGSASGGYGGQIKCLVDVPAGTVLTIVVGGQGGDLSTTSTLPGPGGGPVGGGFEGGTGGETIYTWNNSTGTGGGGGSAILIGSTLIVVAGGGGGARAILQQSALNGGIGMADGNGSTTGTNGRPGTLSAEGAGGPPTFAPSLAGADGFGHLGGEGGLGAFLGGAGGGGGYFGGGGGGGSGALPGHGGGASSWADTGVCTDIGNPGGAWTGAGYVTIELDELPATGGWSVGFIKF